MGAPLGNSERVSVSVARSPRVLEDMPNIVAYGVDLRPPRGQMISR